MTEGRVQTRREPPCRRCGRAACICPGGRLHRQADPACERLTDRLCNACLCNAEVPGYISGCKPGRGLTPCGPECNGTWPHAPGEPPRAFHVKDCPNDPALRGRVQSPHVERKTAMKDGQTYCSCGSPWPCSRRDMRVEDVPEEGLMLPACCDTEAWRFTDPITREAMVRVLHDEDCSPGQAHYGFQQHNDPTCPECITEHCDD